MLQRIGHAHGQGLEFGLGTTASILNKTSQTTHTESFSKNEELESQADFV
jgi:hypothetical protein